MVNSGRDFKKIRRKHQIQVLFHTFTNRPLIIYNDNDDDDNDNDDNDSDDVDMAIMI